MTSKNGKDSEAIIHMSIILIYPVLGTLFVNLIRAIYEIIHYLIKSTSTFGWHH